MKVHGGQGRRRGRREVQQFASQHFASACRNVEHLGGRGD